MKDAAAEALNELGATLDEEANIAFEEARLLGRRLAAIRAVEAALRGVAETVPGEESKARMIREAESAARRAAILESAIARQETEASSLRAQAEASRIIAQSRRTRSASRRARRISSGVA
jgi:hypothetical protein